MLLKSFDPAPAAENVLLNTEEGESPALKSNDDLQFEKLILKKMKETPCKHKDKLLKDIEDLDHRLDKHATDYYHVLDLYIETKLDLMRAEKDISDLKTKVNLQADQLKKFNKLS
mmetsp:Transcript_3113/g.4764  ORF Transcript_3113/g.4764 Transcript_3113/m.4764 type:complete len:115 (+) Transcript_3113:100-444(+)